MPKISLAIMSALLLPVLASAPATVVRAESAVCTPPCPAGQVCKWKDATGGGGATVCSSDIITPTWPNHGRAKKLRLHQ
jgi:hypothetical protein